MNLKPRFIIKQALYDKSRTLQPILRELALSRQLASSSFIKQWAHSPEDKQLTQTSLRELENFRTNFRDKNYFVAFLSNGHYYHNNASNEFQGKEFRYILSPEKKSDTWYWPNNKFNNNEFDFGHSVLLNTVLDLHFSSLH